MDRNSIFVLSFSNFEQTNKMKSENYEVLSQILEEFQYEKEELQKKIDENLIKVKEADYYINALFEEEDNDFKVFSPRDVESIHKNEIKRCNEEKDICQQRNEEFAVKDSRLSSRIEHLQRILIEEKAQEEYEQKNKKDKEDKEKIRERNLAALAIQEADRQRIARELHDTSLQNLACLVHKIELSSLFIDQDPVRAKLELSIVNKNIRSVMDEIRNNIFNLRPMAFDDLGFKASLERLINMMNQEKKYELDIDIDDISCENSLILLTIYRAIKECLKNIEKHAEADKIALHCKLRDNICIIDIEDNGKGFTKEEVQGKKDRHFGIALMKERINLLGGKAEIYSEINKGTKVHMETSIN